MKKFQLLIMSFLFCLSSVLFGVPAGTGQLYFSPVIDSNGEADSNPLAGTSVPVLDILGEPAGLINLAVELVPDNPQQAAMAVPVTFKVWQDTETVFFQTVTSDAWGAAQVQVHLTDLDGCFFYQAEAPGYGHTELRTFTFDTRTIAHRIETGALQLSYQLLDTGRIRVILDVDGSPGLVTGKATLQMVRYLEDQQSSRPGYRPFLPLPFVELYFTDSTRAEAELQLPPGQYGLLTILEKDGPPHLYSYSSPLQLTIIEESTVSAGVPLWVSPIPASPDMVMVQYQTDPGQAAFGIVASDQAPVIPKIREGENRLTRTRRSAPFILEEVDYQVNLTTIFDDGKKTLFLEDFDYDPIACRYTLAIRSLQDIEVADMLRVDIIGPGGILLKEIDTQVVLPPGQIFHYSFEVPAELGKPESIRVTLDDPLDTLVSDLIAVAKRLKVSGSVTASLTFSITVLSWEILAWDYTEPPGTEIKGGYQPPNLEEIIKNIIKDLFELQFVVGSVSLADEISFLANFTFDAGLCPNPDSIRNLENRLAQVAWDLNDVISDLPSWFSIESPPFPIPIGPVVIQAWGELGAGLRGNASAAGLTISIGAQFAAEGSFSVGWKFPGFNVKETADAMKAAYRLIQALYIIADFADMISQMQGMVSQGDCNPDPPDPGPPDDRQDVWQGIESFFLDNDLGKAFSNLHNLLSRCQNLNLELAEKYFTLRLRELEMKQFSSDTRNYVNYLAELEAVLTAAQAQIDALNDQTQPLPAGMTLDEALYQQIELAMTELNQLDYVLEQQRLSSALAVAERFYQELEGRELELQREFRRLFTEDVIGVLASGFAEATLGVLDVAGLPAQLLSTWPGNNQFRGKPAVYVHPRVAPRVLVAPAGSLHMLAGSPSAVRWLDEYVAGGGLLIAFTQAFGSDWAVLPGGEIRGVGYEEDQRCQHASVKPVASSSWLCWMGVSQPDIQVDGAFTSWPEETELLLLRTMGTYTDYPAMLTYAYGQGRVLATTAYGDWAYQTKFWWGDEWQMTRSLLIRAWLLVHGMDIEDISTADPDSIMFTEFPVTNRNSETVTSVQVTLPVRFGGWGANSVTNVPITIAPGETRLVTAEIMTPSVMRGVHNWTQIGLYHIKSRLNSERGGLSEGWGSFGYVRSPVIHGETVNVSLGVEPRQAALYHPLEVVVNLISSFNEPKNITLQGTGDLPSEPVSFILEPGVSVEYRYPLIMDGSKVAGVRIYNESGQLINSRRIQIPLSLPQLQTELRLPAVLVNGSPVTVALTNNSVAPVPGGNITCRLKSPLGSEIWSATFPFNEVAPGTAATPGTNINLPAFLPLGYYSLEYTITNSNEEISGPPARLPNSLSADLLFRKERWQIRNPLEFQLQIRNTGCFNLAPGVTLKQVDSSWQTEFQAVVPGSDTWSTPFSVLLPESLTAGDYIIEYSLSLAQTEILSASETFCIPEAEPVVFCSADTIETGQAVPINLTNTGGVDTVMLHYIINLEGMTKDFLLADEEVQRVLPVNGNVTVEGMVPAGTASGAYHLHFYASLADGEAVAFHKILYIAGPELDLTAVTDRKHYLTRDEIDILAQLANRGQPLADGRLDLQITGMEDEKEPPVAWQSFQAGDRGVSQAVEAVEVDQTGRIWTAMADPNWGEGGVSRENIIYNNSASEIFCLEPDLKLWQAVILPEELGDAHVSGITSGNQGEIWFATNRGAAMLDPDGDEWVIYLDEDYAAQTGSAANVTVILVPFESDRVTAVAFDAADNLWLATDEGAVMLSPAGTWQTFTEDDGLASDFIYTLATDQRGNIWFATDAGLSCFDSSGAWRTYDSENGLLRNETVDLAFDLEGSLWLANPGDQGGLSVLRANGQWEYYTEENGSLEYPYIISLTVDKYNRKWAGFEYGELLVISGDNSRLQHYDYRQLGAYFICDLAAAANGDVWIGYQYDWSPAPGNLARAYPGPYLWEGFDSETSGIPYYELNAITADRTGRIWMTGYSDQEASISSLDPNRNTVERIDLPAVLQEEGVNDLAVDSRNNIWIGTYNGLAMYDQTGEDWTVYQLTGSADDPPLLGNSILSLAADTLGSVWFHSSDGVQCLTADGQWKNYTWEMGLPFGEVNTLECDTNGNTWLATNYGLSRIAADSTVRMYGENDGLLPGIVRCLSVDAGGNVWFASTNWEKPYTVSQLRTDGTLRHYPVPDNLLDRPVENLLADSTGNIWITGYDAGVLVFNPVEDSWYIFRDFNLDYLVVREFAVAPDGGIWMATEKHWGGSELSRNKIYLCAAGYSELGIPLDDYDEEDISLLHAIPFSPGGSGRILWEYTASLNLDTAEHLQVAQTVAAAALNATGRLNLKAEVRSPAEQLLAKANHSFYVFPTAAGLTLEADREIYKTGEIITLSGSLFNESQIELAEQIITITGDEAELAVFGPVTVSPGESFPWQVLFTAPETAATLLFTAAAPVAVVSTAIHVTEPSVSTRLLLPDLVTREPFSLSLLLSNDGPLPAQLVINLPEGSVETVNLAGGESTMISRTLAVNADTEIRVQIDGDLKRELSHEVKVCADPVIEWQLPAAGSSGVVALPYTITGLNELPVTVYWETAADNGMRISDTAVIEPGQVISGRLLLRLAAGRHQLTTTLGDLSGRILAQSGGELLLHDPVEPALPACQLTDFQLTPVPAPAGSTVTARIGLENSGSSRPVVIGLQLFGAMQQWVVTPPAFAAENYLFNLEIPADVPAGTYPGKLQLDDQEQSFTLPVTGPDLTMSLELDKAWYLPGEEVSLTVRLHENAGLDLGYSLFFRYLDEEEVRIAAVPAAETREYIFRFPAGITDRASITLSNAPSPEHGERVITIDSLAVVVASGESSFLVSDKGVYAPGEIVNLEIHVQNRLNSLLVQGPVELTLAHPHYMLLWPQDAWKEEGLVRPGIYTHSYVLPEQMRSGRYTFLMQADHITYNCVIDVKGSTVTSRAISLDKVRYARQDRLTATVEFVNSGSRTLSGLALSALIFPPGDTQAIPLDPFNPQLVDLVPGLNTFTLAGTYNSPLSGPHRLLVKLAPECCAPRVAAAAAQFDIGEAYLVDFSTDHGNYSAGATGTGRLDVYGQGPARLTVTSSGGSVLFERTAELSGFGSYSFAFPAGSSGNYLLQAVCTDNAGETDRLLCAYAVAAEKDKESPVITVTSPADGSVITNTALEYTITVEGTASDNAGLQMVLINGRQIDMSDNAPFALDLTLRRGSNHISAAALDAAGNISYAPGIEVYLLPERTLSLNSSLPSYYTGETILLQTVLTAELPYADVALLQTLPLALAEDLTIIADSGTVRLDQDETHYKITWQGAVTTPVTLQITATAAAAGSFTAAATAYWGWGFTGEESLTINISDGIPGTAVNTVMASSYVTLSPGSKITAAELSCNKQLKLMEGAAIAAETTVQGNAHFYTGSRLTGNLTLTGYLNQQTGADILGTVTTESAVILPSVPYREITPGTVDWIVKQGNNTVCVPGAYRDVYVHAGETLSLRAGIYTFKSLRLAPGAALHLEAGDDLITINVAEKLYFDENSRVTRTAGSRTVFYSNTTRAVYLRPGALLESDLITPHAPVYLKDNAQLHGSLACLTLYLYPGAGISPLNP